MTDWDKSIQDAHSQAFGIAKKADPAMLDAWKIHQPPAGWAVRSRSSSAPQRRGSWLRRFLQWLQAAV